MTEEQIEGLKKAVSTIAGLKDVHPALKNIADTALERCIKDPQKAVEALSNFNNHLNTMYARNLVGPGGGITPPQLCDEADQYKFAEAQRKLGLAFGTMSLHRS